ncbi:kinase-like protein, partial [Fomitiporia mediterranea MF3/22]|uniref:kinase-like protein n=1 Tax=Fomitiporia mediterranea (strain MF3/22) TaxID=694068 RepID=UPI0004409AD4
KELYIWSRLDHTNILQLQGFVLEGDYPVVIAEWMENGTLREYLQKRTDCSVEDMVILLYSSSVHCISLLYHQILGIANGVDYLHRQNVVHSDLKADNVLVNHLGDPLICDFGISRMLSSTVTFAGATSGGIKGSMRWMAYELLDFSSDGHHTKESDVWAFGMTVYVSRH